jgi:GntR family transcriptional regulator
VVLSSDAESPGSKYEQIANDLRTAIEAGEYEPGDRLPGERVLAAQYSVAAMTVRQALNVLKSEGLAEARQGAGVFVRAFRPIRRRGIQRLARDQWGAGNSIWSTDESREVSIDQITVGEVTPPESVAAVLGLDGEQTACRRSRRYLVERRPVMLATSYLPYQLVEGSAITESDTGPGGLFARLADLGHAPVHHREEVRFGLASSNIATRLELPPNSPVLHITRTSYTAERLPVEVNQMILDAAAYVLDYEFDA